MKKVVNQFNFNPRSSVALERCIGESMTIPDMTMSLRELLERFTRGQSVATFTPVYQGEEEMPDITHMDPLERMDYARKIRENIQLYQNRASLAVEQPVTEPTNASD